MIRILTMAEKTFSNFMAGQCVEAMILGSLFLPCCCSACPMR